MSELNDDNRFTQVQFQKIMDDAHPLSEKSIHELSDKPEGPKNTVTRETWRHDREDYDPAIHGVSDGSGVFPLMVIGAAVFVWFLAHFFPVGSSTCG